MNTTMNPAADSGKKMTTRALARGAVIAALYAALTLLLAPLSYGEVQIRFSEAFTLLPVLLPEAVPALAVGCLLSNILGGCTIFDIVFGTLATLLAALCTRRLRDHLYLAAVMPVLFNGVIVGAVVHFCYAPVIPLALCMLSVAAGEAVACLIVGPLVVRLLRRLPKGLLE
ncbi:MAG: QueT transporter family protein [Clostridia bacterium]|nr:QueT transporter family protein [Clostridia bacterium]